LLDMITSDTVCIAADTICFVSGEEATPYHIFIEDVTLFIRLSHAIFVLLA